METGDDVRLADEYMRTKGREAEQLEGERERQLARLSDSFDSAHHTT